MKRTRLTSEDKQLFIKLFTAPMRFRDAMKLLEKHRVSTKYVHRSSLTSALLRDNVLHQFSIKASANKSVTLFAAQPQQHYSPYTISQVIAPTGYFCNLSAVYYHGLTIQVPKTVYRVLSRKQAARKTAPRQRTLTDHAIFEAFIKPHRVTSHMYKFLGYTIAVTERASTVKAGVVNASSHGVLPAGSQVTCLERTLIDTVVNPQYAGGILDTIDYFAQAKDKLDPAKLVHIYDQLRFFYPYWQSIGFIADRTGVQKLATLLHKKYKLKNRFFIDHGAKTSWLFDHAWRIHYPKGLFRDDTRGH